jgi:hypothetical protein
LELFVHRKHGGQGRKGRNEGVRGIGTVAGTVTGINIKVYALSLSLSLCSAGSLCIQFGVSHATYGILFWFEVLFFTLSLVYL